MIQTLRVTRYFLMDNFRYVYWCLREFLQIFFIKLWVEFFVVLVLVIQGWVLCKFGLVLCKVGIVLCKICWNLFKKSDWITQILLASQTWIVQPNAMSLKFEFSPFSATLCIQFFILRWRRHINADYKGVSRNTIRTRVYKRHITKNIYKISALPFMYSYFMLRIWGVCTFFSF